jgi:hypothetical protein
MSLKTFFLLFLLLNFNAKIFGQINVYKDNRIDALVEKKRTSIMGGYRIQICFDSDKVVVNNARTKFSNLFPKIDTYMNFEAPNFNLLVGDFRTLIEAEKIQEKILGEFTISIIKKEIIHLPRVD